MLRIETSFQDTPDGDYYFVLNYRGRSLAEQLEELDLKGGAIVLLYEADCNFETEATLLVNYKHPMMTESALWARAIRPSPVDPEGE